MTGSLEDWKLMIKYNGYLLQIYSFPCFVPSKYNAFILGMIVALKYKTEMVND